MNWHIATIAAAAVAVGLLASCASPQEPQPQLSPQEVQAKRDRWADEQIAAHYAACDDPGVHQQMRTVLLEEGLFPLHNVIDTEPMATGNLRISTAEMARKRGCTKLAEELYNGVFEIYTGTAYQGLWIRAQSGLDKIEAKDFSAPRENSEHPTRARRA